MSKIKITDNCLKLGNIYNPNFTGGSYAGNVYDIQALCPTLTNMQGGGREPHTIEVLKMEDIQVLGNYMPSEHDASRVVDIGGVAPTVKENHGTVTGVVEVKGVIPSNVECLGNIEPINRHQSGNVYSPDGVSPNIMAGTHGYGMGFFCDQQIVAMRGRDKDNPSDRTAGNPNLEQRLEPNTQGTSNTITTVQKDNLVLETKSIKIKQATKHGFVECEIGGVADLNYTSSTTRRGRVQEGGRMCPTLCSENVPSLIELGDERFYNFLYEIDGSIYLIRIRKLIPLECWRLMGFTDDDFRKAEQVNSNTQLYKQAGNSIVEPVLMALFSQLGIQGHKRWNDMTEEERYKLIERRIDGR